MLEDILMAQDHIIVSLKEYITFFLKITRYA